MTIQRPFLALMLVLAVLLFPATIFAGDTAFQYSTMPSVRAGLFDGRLTVSALHTHGDFGFGLLNGLDGQLVLLDGVAYHIAAGGETEPAAPDACLPFALVAHFEEEAFFKIGKIDSLDVLNEAVLQSLESPNYFYAIRFDGRFTHLKARAIPRQNQPYITYEEAERLQQVVQYSEEGTLVGLYCPVSARGMAEPGFVWQFLSTDRKRGGQVVDLSMSGGVARVDVLRSVFVQLPDSKDFGSLDLTPHAPADPALVATDAVTEQ